MSVHSTTVATLVVLTVLYAPLYPCNYYVSANLTEPIEE